MENKTNKLMPALYGGLLIGVISGIPGLNFINCACCAGVIAGGLLSVFLYRRSIGPFNRIESGEGAGLGLLAGLFGTIISTIISGLIFPGMNDFFYQMSSRINDPDVEAFLEQINPMLMARGMMLFGFLLGLVVNGIFGLLGGLFGVMLFGKPKESMDTVKTFEQTKIQKESRSDPDGIVVEDHLLDQIESQERMDFPLDENSESDSEENDDKSDVN